MDVEFVGTKLVRPDGAIHAKWIGAIGTTGMVNIRYWKLDPETAHMHQVMTAAKYCPTHCILYLDTDYPQGCPECTEATIHQSASLSK